MSIFDQRDPRRILSDPCTIAKSMSVGGDLVVVRKVTYASGKEILVVVSDLEEAAQESHDFVDV